MDTSQTTTIIILLILLFTSAVFSSSETAFLSVNKIRMRNLSQEGNKKAQLVERLLEDGDRLFASILVGNNLVNILASSMTTSLMISVFGNQGVYIAYATGIVTLLILVFGEITPKSLATKKADSLAFALANFINLVVVVTTPVVIVLNRVSRVFIILLGGSGEIRPTVTEEELKTIVTVSHEEGVLQEEKRKMIHNVFDFGETEIRDIMTPRINVTVLDEDCDYDELVEVYQKDRYSRYPVHSESFDEVVGVLNIKDLLFFQIDPGTFKVSDYLRDAFVVYEFNHIDTVFESMRKEHATMAVVLDEYGVFSGIVTFEDIVEEIVGDIADEYDDEFDKEIFAISQNEYLVDGTTNIIEVNEFLKTNFDEEEFDSIGGLVLGALKSTPEVNDEIVIDNYLFKIIAIDKRRIDHLKITKIESEES